MNATMLIERENHIGADFYQRGVQRNGHANGFKPRTFQTAIDALFVYGVSTRRVTKVMEDLCGFKISSGQVSNLNNQLGEEFAKWRSHPLPEIKYLILDVTYYKVHINGIVRNCTTIKSIGIRRDDSRRILLGVSCALSKAEANWREFLVSL